MYAVCGWALKYLSMRLSLMSLMSLAELRCWRKKGCWLGLALGEGWEPSLNVSKIGKLQSIMPWRIYKVASRNPGLNKNGEWDR